MSRLPLPRRLGAALAVVTALTGTVVAGTPGPAPAATACRRPPVTVTVLPGPAGTTGPAELAVTDAVARRVPIVPRAPEDSRRNLPALQAEAATTDLALYTLYLADFRVPRAELRGFGFGEVEAPPGKTVAAVTVVPTEKGGFTRGDRVEVEPFAYDATTTFAPISVVVNRSGERSTYAYDGVTGGATIRTLTDRTICLDVDVTFTRGGTPVASAVGTVKAPVVDADPAFFYT